MHPRFTHPLLRTALTVLVASTAAVLAPQPAHADLSVLVSLTGPDVVAMKTTAVLAVKVTAGNNDPIADASVVVEKRVHSEWVVVGDTVTDSAGSALWTVDIGTDKEGAYRATATETGTPSLAHVIAGAKQTTTVSVAAPHSIVDGHRTKIRVDVATRLEGPVRHASVTLFSRSGHGWVTEETSLTRKSGRVAFKVAPRDSTKYRVKVAAGTWFKKVVVGAPTVMVAPPGIPVALPSGAPRPNPLPQQTRASGPGAQGSVQKIPGQVWRDMRGRSWQPGCTGRNKLRLVRVNYFGFDGFRYRGELVVHRDVADRVQQAFTAIHDARLPIRSMYRIDRFGYSERLNGADDYASMASGNTSAFNCRDVVGRPGVPSPHAKGRSIDINPWENPYMSHADGWVPNGWWRNRSHHRVAWRTDGHRMVRLLAAHGIKWTYKVRDAHHFDA